MNTLSLIDKNLEKNHKTPVYKITVIEKDGDQKDITTVIKDRLISLQIIDNRGFEADELDLQLSDHDGKLAFPSRNATIEVAIGWKGQALVSKGNYSVDEIQYSCSPDILTIRARSADLKGSLNSKKERSFHDTTFGKLINQIAGENKFNPLCHAEFKDKKIAHLDQTNESDINFLSRLAKENDAIATVKNSNLLFMPTGTSTTATGKPLPPVEIIRSVGDSFNFSIIENDNFTAVRAYWHNLDTGKKGEVVVDENTKIERKAKITKTGKNSKNNQNVIVQNETIETDANKIHTLRHTYKTEASALNGAIAAFKKIQRGVATFSMTLAFGNPELMPELPAAIRGIKTEIDSTDWIISKVTHNLSDNGYTSVVEFELNIEHK